jgi:isoleucyl-tRNA synthetase
MKASLATKEPEMLRFWEENRIYEALREKMAGSQKYILHDGPPYANGDIHIGTTLNKILKDIIVKFKSLSGYDSPYLPGWDCHGLPIEHEVMKKIKDSNPDRLRTRKECHVYAQKFIGIQREQFQRLGVFGEWSRPYLTMAPSYEAKIVTVFGKLVEKGLIYQAFKPVHWCIHCQTALAEAEVEYANYSSLSIYVKFSLPGGKLFSSLHRQGIPTSILIWTTTAWTLPANLAVAVHPEYEYAAVEVSLRGKEEALIIVADMVDETMKKAGIANYKVAKTIPGKGLAGLEYLHPLNGKECHVILGKEVVKDEGTGCVHIAPGHGEADYELGLKYNLDILAPVDSNGVFTEHAGEFQGKEIFAGSQLIVDKLLKNGSLLHRDFLTHSYPHCWRCREPVIFRATKQWFISMDNSDLRRLALKEIEAVQWIPGWGRVRIGNMVATRPDWCISRQRVWGVPLPVFYCRSCRKALLDVRIINSIATLFEREGSDSWFRMKEKDILPAGTNCIACGGEEFEKEMDILDVWFESGVSHQAVIKEEESLSYPADLYLEGSDQHRGWFQSSLLTAVGIGSGSPYRAVLTHGFVVDGKGKKMSKSLGNLISATEAVEKFGADIIRLWAASEDYRGDIAFSEEILLTVRQAYRRIRNSCRYILGNIYDFDPAKDRVATNDLLEIDRWALSQLANLLEKTRDAYESFRFHRIYHDLHNFCSVTLGSFYFDVLKDRLYILPSSSAGRRSAQTALYEILLAMVKIMAPVLSFTAEEVWQCLPHVNNGTGKRGKEKSVFLSSFPGLDGGTSNDVLDKKWSKLIKIREEVYRVLERHRQDGMIGSFLESNVTIFSSGELTSFLREYESELATIFIVSGVTIVDITGEEIPDDITPAVEFKEMGIKVSRAKGKKCARCWVYSEAVKGGDSLCERCTKITRNGVMG